MKNYISYILLLLFFTSGLFFRCANPASPSGGPKDTIPPKILSIVPNNFSTNFKAEKIVITFDEYSVMKDVQKEIVIAPPMAKRPTFTIKGKSLEIKMDTELDSATTYKIDFGKSIRDNNEGNILMNFSYIFSTGDYIDSLVMTGQMINAETGDTVINGLVYLYDEINDSLDVDSTIFIGKPLSVARTDSNGVFIATNLKDMNYLVYGIEDKNGNAYYDVGDDRVGFSDVIRNPTDMPSFKMWYNDRRQTIEATPQFRINTFSERQKRRQNLQEMTRTQRGILTFYFAADSARVESLELENIAPEDIYTEFKPTGDTLTAWIMQPDSLLLDTMKGSISYHVLSSLGEDSIATKKINLISLGSKEQRKEARQRERQNERAERAGGRPERGERPEQGDRSEQGERPERPEQGDNQARPSDTNQPKGDSLNRMTGGRIMKFNFMSSLKGKKNVVDDIEFTFNVPIKEFNKERVTFEMAVPEEEVRGDRRLREEKVETRVEDLKRQSVDFNFEQDSVTSLIWRLSADWQPKTTYFLNFKDSSLVNIRGEISDSLIQKIEIMDPEQNSVIILDVVNADSSVNYIIELIDSKSKTPLYRNTYTNNGTYTLDYVAPGNYKIKLIQDVNNNGKWDSGELLIKKAPEKVDIFSDENGMSIFETKANWEQNIKIDIDKLFK